MGTPVAAPGGVRRKPRAGPITPIRPAGRVRRGMPGRLRPVRPVPVAPAAGPRIRARPVGPRGPRAQLIRSVVGHRISHVHVRKSAPTVAHGSFSGSYWRESVTPRLSWQHLAPGHYIAKARRGMTPGIRQHVLRLLNRAKGYIWINGKRHTLKQAKTVLFDLLGKRHSVDIKLTNDFPFPRANA